MATMPPPAAATAAGIDTPTAQRPPAPPAALDGARAKKLRLANAGLGVLHLVQALVILALSEDFALPITEVFPVGPPGTAPPTPETLLEIQLGPAVAAFLLLAAADHLLMAAPKIHTWYEGQLRQRINPARWIEYSLSATLMILLIGAISGVVDATAWIAIIGANVSMIMFGHRQERVNGGLEMGDDRIDFQPFWFGTVVGLVPWVAVGLNVFGAEAESGQVPTFVFGIYTSLFILFGSFGANQYLQYKGVGRWKDYIFGEWVYLWLSLIAKSLLAWQIFANTLIPQ